VGGGGGLMRGLSADNSELIRHWYQQHVQRTSPSLELVKDQLSTVAHVQHLLGTCAQSVSLQHGECPYYMDTSDTKKNDVVSANINEFNVTNVLCIVWRVETVTPTSFLFSAERVTQAMSSSSSSSTATTTVPDTNESNSGSVRSLRVSVDGDVATYTEVDGDNESLQVSSSGDPLPVMLSQYISKWSVAAAGDGCTLAGKRGRSNSRSGSSKKKNKN